MQITIQKIGTGFKKLMVDILNSHDIFKELIFAQKQLLCFSFGEFALLFWLWGTNLVCFYHSCFD